MSILNIALQNGSLERDSMDDNNEKIISQNSSMVKLRSATEDNLNIKEAFQKSMENVISLVGSRFECMNLKEEAVNCHEACDDMEVDAFFDYVRVIDENIDKNKLTVAELTRLEKYSKFLEYHCCSTTYTFQIKNNATTVAAITASLMHPSYQSANMRN